MTGRTRSDAVLSFGFACVCFLDVLALLTSPHHDTVFHLIGPASALFVPALANILLLATVCFAALWSTLGYARLHRALAAMLVCATPWIAGKNLAALLGVVLKHRDSVVLFAVCVSAFLVLGGLPGAGERLYRRSEPVLRGAFFVLAIVGGLFFVESVWFGWQARHLNDVPPPSAAMAARAGTGSGRVIWIVLDELGYEQVYGGRLPGLALPAFDRLRDAATVFSDVKPAGMYTEIVLPELMTGVAATGVRLSADGQRLRMDAAGGRSTVFEARNTIFADADRLGYRTGVVGWYIPYCRMLAPVLSTCFWTGQTELSALFPAHTIGPNLVHPLLRLLHKVPSFFRPGNTPSRDEQDEGALHIADFVALDGATKKALADPRTDFLLLHLPVPHPSGIWDRRTGRFAVDRSSYVDNLALADRFLGSVMAQLQAQGEWDGATVVVMGDHAWRTQLLWTGTRAWKAADEAASHGGAFDPRPGYVVKLPGQRAGAEIATPFAAIRTRALLDELLRRDVKTPAALREWVESGTP